MGILKKKKKQPPSIEIPQSVRKQVEDDLLQHFSQYEFSRKGSEIALSRVLLDKALEAMKVEKIFSIESLVILLANNQEAATDVLTKICVEWAEMLNKDNALEPLIDKYFTRHGNFR